MKCLDYRRMLLTGQGETEAMRAHRLQCAFCAPLFDEHAAFEEQLRSALQVPVPPELEQRLLATGPGSTRGALLSNAGRRRFLAAAAVVAGGIGAGIYAWFERNDPMAMACIQFVMKDEAKSIMMGAMPRAEAARILAESLPIERIERIGQIRHIAPCPFGGGTAYHVILMVPQDKVTLLVMPDSRLVARARARHDDMYAIVIPLRKGSVGVVGTNPAVVDAVAGALQG